MRKPVSALRHLKMLQISWIYQYHPCRVLFLHILRSGNLNEIPLHCFREIESELPSFQAQKNFKTTTIRPGSWQLAPQWGKQFFSKPKLYFLELYFLKLYFLKLYFFKILFPKTTIQKSYFSQNEFSEIIFKGQPQTSRN